MTDTIAISGIVATDPNPVSTKDDLAITSFRLATKQRRFDPGRGRWIDGETNWYSVTAFRQLAANIMASVIKGDKVIVTGKLRIRDWVNGEKRGTNVDIEAIAVGHNLAWGTTTFTKPNRTAGAPVDGVGADSFGADSFGADSFGAGEFSADSFSAGPISADSFGVDSFGGSAINNEFRGDTDGDTDGESGNDSDNDADDGSDDDTAVSSGEPRFEEAPATAPF